MDLNTIIPPAAPTGLSVKNRFTNASPGKLYVKVCLSRKVCVANYDLCYLHVFTIEINRPQASTDKAVDWRGTPGEQREAEVTPRWYKVS